MAKPVTTFEKYRAFSVHLFTASGALWAFFSIIAAAEQRWVATFAWLGVALLVDGVDGPLARRIDITRVLPTWSGHLLDSIVDYVTYVFIPAVALYLADIIDPPFDFVAAALIVTTSAMYYAKMEMKSEDNYFIGFPVVWNMVVFSLFVVQPTSVSAFTLVLICCITTFLPIKFLHPVRVTHIRPLNLAILGLWSGIGVGALLLSFDVPFWMKAGLVTCGLYLFSIGGLLQLRDRC